MGVMVVWGYAPMVSALSMFYIMSTLAREIATVGSLQSFIIPPCLMFKVKKLGSPCSSSLQTNRREFICRTRPSSTYLHEHGRTGPPDTVFTNAAIHRIDLLLHLQPINCN